jgi:hypothetical protein
MLAWDPDIVATLFQNKHGEPYLLVRPTGGGCSHFGAARRFFFFWWDFLGVDGAMVGVRMEGRWVGVG